MWKLKNVSATHILREINLVNLECQKLSFLTGLGALNFHFSEFVHFLKAEIYQKLKFTASKTVKIAVLRFLIVKYKCEEISVISQYTLEFLDFLLLL